MCPTCHRDNAVGGWADCRNCARGPGWDEARAEVRRRILAVLRSAPETLDNAVFTLVDAVKAEQAASLRGPGWWYEADAARTEWENSDLDSRDLLDVVYPIIAAAVRAQISDEIEQMPILLPNGNERYAGSVRNEAARIAAGPGTT